MSPFLVGVILSPLFGFSLIFLSRRVHSGLGTANRRFSFENRTNADQLFENALKFKLEYYPQGKFLEVFTHEKDPHLPWVFRLPIIAGEKRKFHETTNHKSFGIKKQTNVIFELKATEFDGENPATLLRSSPSQ